MAVKGSIVIPVYNEEQGIEFVLRQAADLNLFSKYEFIVVDDGSTDTTKKTAENYPVKVISHFTRKGYGAAIKTGIRHAKGEKVVIMDGDGQHTLLYLNRLIKLLDDFSLVIGTRDNKSAQDPNRILGKKMIKLIGEYLVEQKLPDFNSGYRGFHRREIMGLLHLMPNGFSFSTTSTLAFIKHGYDITTIPIRVRPRLGRKSNVNLLADGFGTALLVTRMIMLFNPLKIFLPTSIFISLVALWWTLFGVIVGPRIPNSAVLLGVLGMLLFFIGLLADQISLLNVQERVA